MKKLLFILSAVFVSVAGWAGVDDWNQPNPFAYDLKSEVIDNGATLKLTYSLNATAVSDYTYNDQLGLQIYLVDENGNRIKKEDGSVWACTTGSIQKGKDHSVTISIADLPPAAKDRPISWEVVVHGNENWSKPKEVYNYNAINTYGGFYPKNVHGIAIEKNPDHPHFGRIYITEACNTSTPRKNSLLEYDMELKYKGYHHKDYLVHSDGSKTESHFSASVNYEPHRVKISEDGRLFVTCYHPTASHAVLEYLGNHTYKSIIKCKSGYTSQGGNVDDNNDAPNAWGYGPHEKYNRRPIAMDVIGRGNDLKIIVAWISPKGWYPTNNKGNWRSQVEIIEYAVGENGCDIMQDEGTIVAIWKDKASSDANAGYLFQQYFNVGTEKQVPAATHGFVDISYDNDGDIWLKVDYAYNANWVGEVYLFKREENDTKKEHDYLYSFSNNGTLSYGANGICIIKNKNDQYELFTGSALDQIAKFTIDKNTSPVISEMKTYTQNGDGSNRIVGMAEDYAGNLYLLNNRGGETNDDNVVVFAMPYDGTRITRAPASQIMTLSDPVPNILATDLRYAPAKSGGKYVFSFFTNTKPEYAEIRFYYSYESMKQSLADVNADNFSGDSISSRDTENLACIYSIPKDKLKQGKIEVELGMVGGELNAQKFITNDSLPRGELYWSVYVQTRKSSVFAPIYQYGGITDNDNGHHRKTIIVNNYPETDMFGSLIVAHNPSTTDDATRANRGLHIYGINPDGNSNDEQATINNAKRYNKRTEYLNQNATEGRLNYPRRMAVAPDGKVYIADEGSATNYSSDTKNPLYNYWRTLSAERPYVLHEHGGVKIWDPDNPNKFTLFTDNRLGTSTGVAIWNGKLYATNTYDEYVKHINSSSNYTKEQQAGRDIGSGYGWNGFAEYILNKYTAPGDWSSWNNNVKEYALNRGDASGNCAIVAMDQGIWMCQHREHTVEIKEHLCEPMADNLEAYVLSFVPYNNYTSEAEYGPRTWRSCTTNGLSWSWPENQTKTWSNAVRTETTPYSDNSQKKESPLQSTPGAGLAYKKINDKEYLYVVNHDGNIVVFEIFNWESKGTSSAKPSVKHVYTYVTPESTKVEREASKTLNGTKRAKNWKTSFITSMCFDYAGNLVTTTGKGNHDAPHDILVYTMPYDRTNAREIQAPNSCRYIPPRVSHLEPRGEIELTIKPFINTAKPCYVDIFRPMPNTSFSTICLPFDLDMSKLTTEKYKGAEVLEFTGVSVNTIGGEKILELQFSNISENQNYPNIIKANVPYIIKPEVRIPGIVQIQKPIRFVTMREQSLTNTFDDNIDDNNGTPNNSITYTGVIPTSQIEVRDGHTLILVAENRLAEMVPDDLNTNTGEIHGFRGYFTLGAPLPQGMQAIISSKDKTVTGLIDVNGKKINIQKFLREGRVFIRVEDKLYTLDGQKVE